MDCFTLPTMKLRPTERRFIAQHLTRPGSDFQKALEGGAVAGTIAIALDQGEIVAWARTEPWRDWPTLEAFVAPAYRGRRLATWCAMGLAVAGVFKKSHHTAVFRPSMIPVATDAGLLPLLFRKEGQEWTRE
jgi:hypothetical protein